MPRDSWHFIRNAGYRAFYDNTNAIVSCDALITETLIPGWRVSQPAGEYPDIAQFTAKQLMECGIVATIEDDIVTPVGPGITPLTSQPFPR
jgi:hypothetical protein